MTALAGAFSANSLFRQIRAEEWHAAESTDLDKLVAAMGEIASIRKT